jgi:hypothetical protein
MRHATFGGLALAFALVGLAPTAAAEKKDDAKLAERVKKAIDKGIQFLRDQEKGKDNLEVDIESKAREGGWTALAMLALLNAGVPPDDPILKRGLEYLRDLPPKTTYTVGLQTMVFVRAGQAVDRARIKRNVEWLLETRMKDGWGYGKLENVPFNGGDKSNTGYALFGLHAAMEADVAVDTKALEELRDFFKDTQQPNGGWNYRRGTPTAMTMTAAGLFGQVFTSEEHYFHRHKLRADGSAEHCGEYPENENVGKAFQWIGGNFPAAARNDEKPTKFQARVHQRFQYPFYCLYGLERAGRLTGQRYFGEHDWYRVGCEFLVQTQNADGSWGGRDGPNTLDRWPVVSTSFALLFLAEGGRPVLMTKFAHGGPDSYDWNNKHSDARNLVAFASRELFKDKPLAWQVFDVRRKRAETEDEIADLAEDLLHSPVVFLNGHRLRLSDKEEKILKNYVENGGVLFAEACCGKEDFDRDFRALMKRMFPDDPLEELPVKHPLWTATGKFTVEKGKPFKLYGVNKGAKTVVIYSPQPLAGYWEENQFLKGRGQTAFELGASVLAYATGLKLPPAPLTEIKIPRGGKPKKDGP